MWYNSISGRVLYTIIITDFAVFYFTLFHLFCSILAHFPLFPGMFVLYIYFVILEICTVTGGN